LPTSVLASLRVTNSASVSLFSTPWAAQHATLVNQESQSTAMITLTHMSVRSSKDYAAWASGQRPTASIVLQQQTVQHHHCYNPTSTAQQGP
jgi:hypothetical protein